MSDYLLFNEKKPNESIANFVESFWMLDNPSKLNKDIIVLPDGRVDLFFKTSKTIPFQITLLGIETQPTQMSFPAHTKIFAISFKLLAVEYILKNSIADLINDAKILQDDFWDFTINDLKNFEQFCNKASAKIFEVLNDNVDVKKINLFNSIYKSKGNLTIKKIAEEVFWSSREINRYFNKQFGLSLKTYITIVRFRASFHHIKEGKLFPEMNFADQAHFIKEVKKLAGVIPKELSKNKNDRFIQFSTLI